MKILLLTTHLNFGGISSYTFSLAKALTKRGHDVSCASAGGEMIGQLQKNAIEHIYIPIKTKSELSPRILASMFNLLRIAKKEPFDIIHAHTRVTQVLAGYLSSITKIPFVSTCHGFFRQNLGRQLYPCWGKKVIAISEAVKKHLMIDFYVAEEQIALIYNGVDIGQFRVASKRKDINRNIRTVGIIARLSPVKGHVYLIEAMKEVIGEFSDARLFIFGQGKVKYDLVRKAERLKISDKLFFLPSVTHTSEIMQEIDIFVMPSLQEGFGLSILEAQACGIPVIASGVGGIPALIRHDVTGLLVPPKEPAALAGAIMKVMENKELAIRLGLQGRRSVEEKFNEDKMVRKIEQVYQKVAKK